MRKELITVVCALVDISFLSMVYLPSLLHAPACRDVAYGTHWTLLHLQWVMKICNDAVGTVANGLEKAFIEARCASPLIWPRGEPIITPMGVLRYMCQARQKREDAAIEVATPRQASEPCRSLRQMSPRSRPHAAKPRQAAAGQLILSHSAACLACTHE